MKRYFAIIAALLIFAAGAASAAIVITLNGYSNVTVSLEPIGLCGTTGDCVFMVTTTGTVLDSAGGARQQETLQFRTDDPVYLAAPYNINPTTTTNLYRKARRAWKVRALDENAD